MLLSFRCDNFKSFAQGFEFNMTPVKRMKRLKHSIINKNAGESKEQALSASVVYGPNAAGKTSVVNAMSCMRQIVIRGNIHDADRDNAGDHVSSDLTLAPFAFGNKTRPVTFDATFVVAEKKIQYAVSAFLGGFLKDSTRYIDSEKLYVNDRLVFDRTKDEVRTLDLAPISDMLNVAIDPNGTDTTRTIMSANLLPESLLLLSDFNSFCSKSLVSEIVSWFRTRFIVINSSNRARFFPGDLGEKSEAVVNLFINRIAEEAGIVGSGFAYVNDPDSHAPRLLSILEESENKVSGVDADLIESVGTLRLVSLMPGIVMALRRGSTIVLDEMDASLHPMIVMNLISIFHNDEVNKHGAQLIFNTHNPIYLNNRLLRRDEIKFVERDKESKSSSLYALSDFRANGSAGARNTSDYMKNYFIGRYGAIENIDFTDALAEILREE